MEDHIKNLIFERYAHKVKDESYKDFKILVMKENKTDSKNDLKKNIEVDKINSKEITNIIVIDKSGSMRSFLFLFKDAWNDIISPELDNKKSNNIIYTFDEEIRHVKTLTKESSRLPRIIGYGVTNLYGAILATYEEIKKSETLITNIFFITDGEHNLGLRIRDDSIDFNYVCEILRRPEKICNFYLLGVGMNFPVIISINLKKILHTGNENNESFISFQQEDVNEVTEKLHKLASTIKKNNIITKFRLIKDPGFLLPDFKNGRFDFAVDNYIFMPHNNNCNFIEVEFLNKKENSKIAKKNIPVIDKEMTLKDLQNLVPQYNTTIVNELYNKLKISLLCQEYRDLLTPTFCDSLLRLLLILKNIVNNFMLSYTNTKEKRKYENLCKKNKRIKIIPKDEKDEKFIVTKKNNEEKNERLTIMKRMKKLLQEKKDEKLDKQKNASEFNVSGLYENLILSIEKIESIIKDGKLFNSYNIVESILESTIRMSGKLTKKGMKLKGDTDEKYAKDKEKFINIYSALKEKINKFDAFKENINCRITLTSTILDMQDPEFQNLLQNTSKFNFLKNFTITGIPAKIFITPRLLLNPWGLKILNIVSAPYDILSQIALENSLIKCAKSQADENSDIDFDYSDFESDFNVPERNFTYYFSSTLDEFDDNEFALPNINSFHTSNIPINQQLLDISDDQNILLDELNDNNILLDASDDQKSLPDITESTSYKLWKLTEILNKNINEQTYASINWNSDDIQYNSIIPIFSEKVIEVIGPLINTEIFARLITFSVIRNPLVIDYNIHMASLCSLWFKLIFYKIDFPNQKSFFQSKINDVIHTAKIYKDRMPYKRMWMLISKADTLPKAFLTEFTHIDNKIYRCETLSKVMFLTYIYCKLKEPFECVDKFLDSMESDSAYSFDSLKISSDVENDYFSENIDHSEILDVRFDLKKYFKYLFIEFLGRNFEIKKNKYPYLTFFTEIENINLEIFFSKIKRDFKINCEEIYTLTTYIEKIKIFLDLKVYDFVITIVENEDFIKYSNFSALRKIKKINYNLSGVNFIIIEKFFAEMGIEKETLYDHTTYAISVVQAINNTSSKDRMLTPLQAYEDCIPIIEKEVKKELKKYIVESEAHKKFINTLTERWIEFYDNIHDPIIIKPMKIDEVVKKAKELYYTNLSDEIIKKKFQYNEHTGLLRNACQNEKCPFFLYPNNFYNEHAKTERRKRNNSIQFPHSLHLVSRINKLENDTIKSEDKLKDNGLSENIITYYRNDIKKLQDIYKNEF
nr:uncharacterized protein LOC128705219 isoform X1 [Cherax quadricarinatus]